MEKLNFWRSGGLLHTRQKGGRRAAEKRRSVGLRKRAGRSAEKGSPPARPFPQPSLMWSPPDRLNVQPTCPSFGAACRPALLCSSPARGKFMFFIWQHSPPARPARRDDRIVLFYYPILSCFWKMISVSDPNPVLVEIILSASENYPKVYHDAQHTFLCFVYFAVWGKITSGVILPSAEHNWLKYLHDKFVLLSWTKHL